LTTVPLHRHLVEIQSFRAYRNYFLHDKDDSSRTAINFIDGATGQQFSITHLVKTQMLIDFDVDRVRS
jgi:hypothetical protein